jgi:hypothetical protein
MSRSTSYERVLGALVAETRIGRLGRALRQPERSHAERDPRPGRAWINGREVGGPNPDYAHLHRRYE